MSIACFSIFPTESENSIRHQAEDTKRSFVFRPAFKMAANFPNFPRKHNGGDSDAEDDIAIVDITDSDNDSHRQLYIESNREPPPTPLESVAIINRIGVIKAQKVGPDGRAADDTEDGRSSSSSIVSTLNSAEDAAKITRICKHCSRSGCNPTITEAPELPYQGRCGELNEGQNVLVQNWREDIEVTVKGLGNTIRVGLNSAKDEMEQNLHAFSRRMARIHASSMERCEWHRTREEMLYRKICKIRRCLSAHDEKGEEITVRNRQIEANIIDLNKRINHISRIQAEDNQALNEVKDLVNQFTDMTLDTINSVKEDVERYLGEAKMMAETVQDAEAIFGGAGLDADDEAEDADDVREAEPKRKMRKTRPNPRRH